jgi:CheY-like chemotaxis protein
MGRLALVHSATRPTRRPHGRTPAELIAHASTAEKVRRPRLDLRSVTVLVVEDHEDSREMLRQIVESFGARVVLASDGREALRIVRWIRPDLVLCDLRMPNIDGFGFIDRIRHDPALSRMAVVAVTALASDADIRRTWEAGFDGHLVKPIDYEVIAAQLERMFWAHHRGPEDP